MSNDKLREAFESWAITSAWMGLSGECLEFIDGGYVNCEVQAAWLGWQASREALVIELPVISDELLTAAYWDFDARRKGYPPYKVPAGHECSDFKVSITSTIVASVLGETVSVPKELV